MHQFDVKTAFLHSPIEEEVYLEQPQEFVRRGSGGEKLVGRLIESNYGLRQGFIRSRNNHCLFARAVTEGHTFILVWVDDIIVASRSMTVISDVKMPLEATIYMEDRRRLHWILDLGIRREEGKITVDQARRKQCLSGFKWINANPQDFQLIWNWNFREFKTETKNGLQDLRKLGWITFASGQTDEARHLVHSQHSVQTHECTYQSILAMRKTTSAIYSRFQRFKTYLKKKLVMI